MNHEDHVALIRGGIPSGDGQSWADLGSGWGAFTLALRDIAGPGAEIWSVDRDANALRRQRAEFERAFPASHVRFVVADFTQPLDLSPLDGILAANAVHFVREQAALLGSWRELLRPGGRVVIVEYETERAVPWIPHPVSFRRLGELADRAGFQPPVRIGLHRSRHGPGMYAALLLSHKPRAQTPRGDRDGGDEPA